MQQSHSAIFENDINIEEEIGVASRTTAWGPNPTIPIPANPNATQFLALTSKDNPVNTKYDGPVSKDNTADTKNTKDAKDSKKK